MSDAPVIWTKWIIRTVLACLALTALSVLVIAISQAREAADRATSRNNLRQLVLSLQNYHDAHLVLPPGGTFTADGAGRHGWGVIFWPYVESGPWYNRNDLRRAWNEGENAGIGRFPLALFNNPSVTAKRDPKEFGLAHYSANAHLMSANSSVSFSKLTDTANVFLVGELGGDFVPWACPYNSRPLGERLNAEPPIYGRPTRDGAFFGMADGSVQFIANDVSPQIMEALRGPDLAGYDKLGKTIVRPAAFPYPRDVLQPEMVVFGLRSTALGWLDYDLRLVKLDLKGFGKGEDWKASDKEFAELKRYPDLRELEARGNFTDVALSELSAFRQLEKLDLASDFITETGLGHVAKLSRLKSLAVSGKQITPEALERLQRLMPNCEVRTAMPRRD